MANTTTKVAHIDFDALAVLAGQLGTTLHSLEASGTTDELHEATGEEILAAIEAAGGTATYVERDEKTGEIVAITATGQRPLFDEIDGDERGGVISQIDAAAKKITGDLAQTSVTANISVVGATTSSSAAVTVASVTGLVVGQTVSGAGIPAGATIAAIGSGSITLSAPATATATGVALTIGGEMQVIGLAEWTLDWKRKTAEATTTDDSAYESSLGSTASWSAKAKYMFLVNEATQAAAIIAAISSPQAPQLWDFFPDITAGHPAYNGLAYIDGITIAAGTGKIVGLDVSLKGTGPLNVTTQLAPVANANTITGLQAED